MADICMCKGDDFPLKKTCYRVLAPQNEFRQSWFTEIPYNHEEKSCDFYMEVKDKSQKRRLDIQTRDWP